LLYPLVDGNTGISKLVVDPVLDHEHLDHYEDLNDSGEEVERESENAIG